MTRYLFVLALAALAACSGPTPAVETPSTILLPADPVPSEEPNTMFIGELDGSSLNDGNTWVAVVEVTVL